MTRASASPRREGAGRMATQSTESKRKMRRQQEAGLGGKKALTTLPLLMQVIGILHLSALCARAVAVAGVVLSPAAAASPGRGAAVVVSRGGSLAVPAERVAARASAKERAQARGNSPAVVATSRGKRPRAATAAAAPAPAATTSPVVSSLWNNRRTAAARAQATSSRSSSSSRCTFSSSSRRGPWTYTTAFVTAPGSSIGHRCYPHHQYRALDGRPVCSSEIPASRGSLDVAALPRRRRPLSMGAGAAAAAAAAAALSVAARLALPVGGIGGGGGGGNNPRPWSGLDPASAVCAVKDSANGLGGGGGGSGGTGGGDGGGGVSGRVSIQQALYAFMRWVLTGAGLGAGRRPRRDGNGGGTGGLQGLFSSLWPFGGGDSGAASRPALENGGSSEGEPGKRTVNSATTVAPAKTQQVQRQYPRPQSTAYPRPKVSVPALLDLGAEEVVADPLAPKKQWLAVSSGVPVEEEAGNPMLSKFLRWFFERMITSRAKLVEGLEVSVDARSNRDAMSGLLQVVGITFNHLRLETLQISGGATMRITGLDLKVMTLLWRRFRSFKKPFEVAGSYVFTSGDLATSPMVRRVVENMMNATLRKLETVATDPLSLSKSVITIMQVTAKRSRLVIDGEMVYDNVKVPFNYRTSIGVKGKGHVVYLKDPEVFWENVGGSLTLPLLPLQTFDIDIGDGARIESIRIVDGQVAVRARFVLSPFPPLVVASMFKRASFRYDVGERLSVTFGNIVQNMRII